MIQPSIKPMNTKTHYLDGVRGIACFIVFIDHMVNELYPSLRFSNTPGFTGEIKRIIAITPLNIIYSGLVSVSLFFILSGFVLSLKYNVTQKKSILVSAAIKRYPRLIIPIAVSLSFYFAISFFVWYKPFTSLGDFFLKTFYVVPFKHSDIPPLWTINFEIYGSFLIFMILFFIQRNKFRYLFYIGLVLYLLFFKKSYYSLFIIGLLLSDLKSDLKIIYLPSVVRFLLFIIGLVLATTPTMRSHTILYEGIYHYLSIFSSLGYGNIFYINLLLGSSLIFISLLDSPLAIRILSLKPCLFLGRTSFSIYLLHMPCIFITQTICNKLNIEKNYISFAVCFLINTPILLIASHYFERYIDQFAIRFSNQFAKKVMNTLKIENL